MERYFEEIEVGETSLSATHLLTKAEIIQYAKEFDPQPMHIDENAAVDTFFETLVASGWHVASRTMQMMVDTAPLGTTPLIGAGVKDLRFAKKVLPETVLQCRSEVLSKKDLENRDFGIVEVLVETRDHDTDELLLSQVWSAVVPNKKSD